MNIFPFSLRFGDFIQKKCAYCDRTFFFNYHYFFTFWQNFASQNTLMQCKRKWGVFFLLGGAGVGGGAILLLGLQHSVLAFLVSKF